MAYYNPQKVVFNPDTGVIQNAGKVGGVLYDVMNKNYQDKLKQTQYQQEQDLRKQQMQINEAMQNNQLLQNERNFDYKKQRDEINHDLSLQKLDLQRQIQDQNNALSWAKYQEDKDYNQKYLDYLMGKNSNTNNNSGFSIDANGNLSEAKTMRDVFSDESQGGTLYNFTKNAKAQNITLNDIYGFSDTLSQKLGNTPFNNSQNLKQQFADILKAEINLALVNITSGRMSNEDRHRLEELVKTDSFYFFDKYAKHDIQKAVDILYRIKNEALKKEYMDVWKTQRYLNDKDNIEKYYANMSKKLKDEKAMIDDFLNGGSLLASKGQRVPLNQVLSPKQPLTQDILQQNNMITFK